MPLIECDFLGMMLMGWGSGCGVREMADGWQVIGWHFEREQPRKQLLTPLLLGSVGGWASLLSKLSCFFFFLTIWQSDTSNNDMLIPQNPAFFDGNGIFPISFHTPLSAGRNMRAQVTLLCFPPSLPGNLCFPLKQRGAAAIYSPPQERIASQRKEMGRKNRAWSMSFYGKLYLNKDCILVLNFLGPNPNFQCWCNCSIA